ncbi:hypothetical protein [Brucella intermedia]|uniref:hypothetical protein n=1 Tax=Brucella intermedia TaxID=94625 RepID=UPI0021C5C7A2|nr:hypothetical protein [Brucella intermedia]UXO85623.1 hypothetical protein N8I72_14765 [Brucella intermedia]
MASEPRCSKPGCGALKIVGKPCTDADCPQQWVHHTDTRPAPAATDTGLETAAKLGGINGVMLLRHIENLRPEAQAAYKDELVLRSQAAELLAAKDAEIKECHENINLKADFIENTIGQLHEAEADNAAKAARIKELENVQSRDGEMWVRQSVVKALEAKLAAAEKVAQLVVQAEEDKSGDPNFYILLMQTAYDKARAVLGGKPL